MKKLFVFAGLIFGLLSVPAMAGDVSKSGIKLVSQTTNALAKKDKDYWTRVWYEKQAAKGKRYKKRVKRSSSKKRRVKRSRRTNRSGRIVAKVDISSQTMKVYQRGRLLHSWKVSTGRKGYSTPTGTWNIHRMHKTYFSKKYHGAPMPYAMFYHRGFAVHGTNAISRLGRTASHGCVRLHPSNAAKLFSMVRRNGGTVKVTY